MNSFEKRRRNTTFGVEFVTTSQLTYIMMAINKQIKILTLALLLIPNSSIFAQTPIANRMKVLVKTLPEGSEIIARYTDMKRHALYYILNNRLYKYDVLNNSQDEINLENRNKIIGSILSKDGKTITIKAGKKQDKHLTDVEELDINSFTGEITIAKTESIVPGELDLNKLSKIKTSHKNRHHINSKKSSSKKKHKKHSHKRNTKRH
ncbi:hypothetical protein [Hoylesella nanceiensis]|uniref:hypothetical protein n=1 Tax=Hoylesella nanceiensis TaxID=425941 RepID=UPI0024201A0B|nr:hypothetical protein [Hoylesella nanceiensis]